MKQHDARAKPYARALFALARDQGKTEVIGSELERVVDLVASDAELRDFFSRPWVSAAAKRAVAVEIARRLGVGTLSRDFLALVAARGRAQHLPAMAQAYRDLLDDELGRVRARVRTAVALADDQRAALAARLGRAFGGKRVVFDETVDPDLLGGFIVESGSVLVDGSLESQLDRMRLRLAAG